MHESIDNDDQNFPRWIVLEFIFQKKTPIFKHAIDCSRNKLYLSHRTPLKALSPCLQMIIRSGFIEVTISQDSTDLNKQVLQSK